MLDFSGVVAGWAEADMGEEVVEVEVEVVEEV